MEKMFRFVMEKNYRAYFKAVGHIGLDLSIFPDPTSLSSLDNVQLYSLTLRLQHLILVYTESIDIT